MIPRHLKTSDKSRPKAASKLHNSADVARSHGRQRGKGSDADFAREHLRPAGGRQNRADASSDTAKPSCPNIPVDPPIRSGFSSYASMGYEQAMRVERTTAYNYYGKRKMEEYNGSNGPSNKKHRGLNQDLYDDRRPSAASNNTRSRFQASQPAEKAKLKDHQSANPRTDLRKGKCRHEVHAHSWELRTLCASGKLAEMAADVARAREEEKKQGSSRGRLYGPKEN
jgi:hypothetical protein